MTGLSVSGISFSGLASGLDTNAIISALLAVERRPIDALQTRETGYKTQKSLFSDLSTALETLRDQAKTLQTSSSFLVRKATVDSDTYLTASASTSAAAGSYDVKVLGLAHSEISRSLGKADATTTQYGNGTLTITINGQAQNIQINNGQNDTLQGIANAINSANIDVTAAVLNTGNGANPYQLVLTGQKTGAANSFSVAATGDQTLQDLATEIDANETTTAQDSQISIDNTTIYRSSNTITDAIAGVTLNLRSFSPTAVTRLTVSTDADATAAGVKKLVDNYNSIVDFIENQSVVDDKGQAKSPLFGDSTLRSIRSGLRQIVGGQVDTGNEAYSLLSQVGISSDTKGHLTLDASKFADAVSNDENAVSKLFTDATNGIATRVYNNTNQITDSLDGTIKARQDGFDSLIKQTQDAIDRGEQRLTSLQQQLVLKFSNLESLLSQLQGQGSAFTATQAKK